MTRWQIFNDCLTKELVSATDNPLIVTEEDQIRVISAYNCHGQNLAFAMESMSQALSELGTLSKKRLERLLDDDVSDLPKYLVKEVGLNSGMMIPHYVVSSLVAQLRHMSQPMITMNFPASGDQEDHTSMATQIVNKACSQIHLVYQVLAIELLCVVQAMEFVDHGNLSRLAKATYSMVREKVPALDEDRSLAPDFEVLSELLKSNRLLEILGENQLSL